MKKTIKRLVKKKTMIVVRIVTCTNEELFLYKHKEQFITKAGGKKTFKL